MRKKTAPASVTRRRGEWTCAGGARRSRLSGSPIDPRHRLLPLRRERPLDREPQTRPEEALRIGRDRRAKPSEAPAPTRRIALGPVAESVGPITGSRSRPRWSRGWTGRFDPRSTRRIPPCQGPLEGAAEGGRRSGGSETPGRGEIGCSDVDHGALLGPTRIDCDPPTALVPRRSTTRQAGGSIVANRDGP